MAQDPRLRCTEGQIGSGRDALRRLIEILPGAANANSFEMRRIEVGLELRLRFENNRGQVPITDREMGGETTLAPLFCRVLEEETYWISLAIRWDFDNDRHRPYVFRTAGLTLFQGPFSQRSKMQLLRAEWAGLRKTGDGNYVHEAEGAGHPH